MNLPKVTRSIRGFSRVALAACVICWIFPGCGGPAPAPTDSGAGAVTPQPDPGESAPTSIRANPSEDPAAPAPKPATLADVRLAIDWFQFPKPNGAMWEQTNLLNTQYWVPGTSASAADFYRKTMAAQGWIENKKANPDPEPEKYQSLEFAKAGLMVGLGISREDEHVKVNLHHGGNVDARRLPKPADAKVTPAHSSYVSYSTASKPESAAEFCRKEIAALGWREIPVIGAKTYAKEGKTIVRLVQNAMQCEVTIALKKEGETEVIYHTFLRSAYDPAEIAATFAAKEIPKPATLIEALQVLDLRKLPRIGVSTPKINTGLRTEYETRSSVAKAVAFYRAKFVELGWVMTLPLEDDDATGTLHFEKAGFLVSLQIRNLINQVNKAGLVSIAITNHGNVDLRQLPYMPGAEIGYARNVQPQYRTPATAEAAAMFYRKELARLGWRETSKGEENGKNGYHLRFSQNDAHLRITIDTPRDGQTPIQVSSEFGGER